MKNAYKLLVVLVLVVAGVYLYQVGHAWGQRAAAAEAEKWLLDPSDKWIARYGDNDTTRMVYTIAAVKDVVQNQQKRIAGLEKALLALNQAVGGPLKAPSTTTETNNGKRENIAIPRQGGIEAGGYRIDAIDPNSPVR